MSKYQVKFYKGNYATRQRKANEDNAIVYIEHHFNSTGKGLWAQADYALALVSDNASSKSRAFASDYSKEIDKEFDEITRVYNNTGLKVGGRGSYNLQFTKMPAILLEPLFVDDPEHVELIKSKAGRERLANVLVRIIKKHFPEGGLVAFSVGHKYKVTNPFDRGAKIYGGGYEADYAELVLQRAAEKLTQ